MCYEPELLVTGHYGTHQPCVFCEAFMDKLIAQGFEEAARTIIDADHATNVLYDNPDEPELSGEEIAQLTERANWAWEDILNDFIPEPGYHLGYLPDDDALWAIPDEE